MTIRISIALAAVLTVPPGSRLAEAQTRGVSTTERFELHSDPWINLHHFLYQWARAEEGLGTGRQRVPVPERESAGELSEHERNAWLKAVRFYRDSVAPRSHFDSTMLGQKRALAGLDPDATALPGDVIAGIGAALLAAMPVYRARWWTAHDQANRRWITATLPKLRHHESRFVELTQRTHGATWPNALVRVDVSAYANHRAGYTAEGWITIYSTDPGNQELYGLETLLHEVQHTRAVGSHGRESLGEAFERAGIEQPENLWHGIIFATAGEFVRIIATAEGLPAHVPYWTRERFQAFDGWGEIVPSVDTLWLPVIRGQATRAQAFQGLVERFRR